MTALTGGFKNSLDPLGAFHKEPGGVAKNFLANGTDPFGFFTSTAGGMQDAQSRAAAAPPPLPYAGVATLTGQNAAATPTPMKTLLGG